MIRNPIRLNRRNLLCLSVASATLPLAGSTTAVSQGVDADSYKIIDTNITLFHWPFRRLPLDEVELLVEKMRSLGIDQAWASSFEAILHRDITSVNRRLVDACRKYPAIVPIGAIHLDLPDWESDLRLCLFTHKMPGVRLYPNYHGYTLDDSRFLRLVQICAVAGRLIQISTSLEDPRTQHSSVRAADVDLSPLTKLFKEVPTARIQLLNHRPGANSAKLLGHLPGLYFETARIESTDGVPQWYKQIPQGHLMFGTHAPFLVPEAALIRVHESGQLDDTGLRNILGENALRLIEAVKS